MKQRRSCGYAVAISGLTALLLVAFGGILAKQSFAQNTKPLQALPFSGDTTFVSASRSGHLFCVVYADTRPAPLKAGAKEMFAPFPFGAPADGGGTRLDAWDTAGGRYAEVGRVATRGGEKRSHRARTVLGWRTPAVWHMPTRPGHALLVPPRVACRAQWVPVAARHIGCQRISPGGGHCSRIRRRHSCCLLPLPSLVKIKLDTGNVVAVTPNDEQLRLASPTDWFANVPGRPLLSRDGSTVLFEMNSGTSDVRFRFGRVRHDSPLTRTSVYVKRPGVRRGQTTIIAPDDRSDSKPLFLSDARLPSVALVGFTPNGDLLVGSHSLWSLAQRGKKATLLAKNILVNVSSG